MRIKPLIATIAVLLPYIICGVFYAQYFIDFISITITTVGVVSVILCIYFLFDRFFYKDDRG